MSIYISIATLIITNIIIRNIRIWIAEHVFAVPNTKIITSRTHLVFLFIGALCVGSILLSSHITQYLTLEFYNILQTLHVSQFVQYIAKHIWQVIFFVCILTLLYYHGIFTKTRTELFLLSTCFLVGGYIFYMPLVQIGGGIYFFARAFIEESHKYLAGFHLMKHWNKPANDIILFSILTSLGFAFSENIVYLASLILDNTEYAGSMNSILVTGGNIIFARGILGFFMHLLFVCFLAIGKVLFGSQDKKRKNIFLILIFFFSGITMHAIYNILLFHNIRRSIPLFLFGGYIFITRVMRNSETLYLREGIQSNISTKTRNR